MKAVMVTGASGFVGSALCCELARTGYAVIAVVRRVVERIPSVTYIEADLTDPATFAGEFPTVDCIIHLAGRAIYSLTRLQTRSPHFVKSTEMRLSGWLPVRSRLG